MAMASSAVSSLLLGAVAVAATFWVAVGRMLATCRWTTAAVVGSTRVLGAVVAKAGILSSVEICESSGSAAEAVGKVTGLATAAAVLLATQSSQPQGRSAPAISRK